MEESTRGRERDIVKVLHSAIISCIPPVAVRRKTPNEVEVGARVEEGGGEAKDKDVEEPAQLPMPLITPKKFSISSIGFQHQIFNRGK